jgi:hypothetical protein
MPEHDTFDLDATFRAFERDVAGVTHPRDAGAAVATARRRRRTTIGAVSAATVLVVGGVIAGQSIATRNTSVGPAQLPPPAAFDARALAEATRGWVPEWHSLTKQGQISTRGADAPRCIATLNDDFGRPGDPGAIGAGGGLLVSPGGAASTTWLSEWGTDHPGASTVAYAAVVRSIDGCTEASADRTYTWDGGVGRSWTITVGRHAQHLWVSRTDRSIGVVWGRAPTGAVPDDVDRRVASLLVSWLQSPKSFHRVLPLPSPSESNP